MPPHVQLVMGPAGVGKSTYCASMQEHAANERRNLHVANLDPAAEAFDYRVAFDIRDLVSVEDVMEEMELGPNGGLLYCMEYLLENLDWLQDHLEAYNEDEYLILDCPGQVELYSHVPVMRSIAEALTTLGVRVCACYLIDATFAADPAKFISGSLLSLSAMVQLELPHLNVLTKCDLVDEDELQRVLDFESASMLLDSARSTIGDTFAGDDVTKTLRDHHEGEDDDVIDEEGDDVSDLSGISSSPSSSVLQKRQLQSLTDSGGGGGGGGSGGGLGAFGRGAGGTRLSKLTYAITSLLDDFTMVAYVPLNLKDEESMELVLRAAESLTQFGEDCEVVERERDEC